MLLLKTRKQLRSPFGERWGAGILLVLGIGLLAAYAQDKPRGKEPPKGEPPKSQAAQPAAGGLRIFIDPATGKIRDGEHDEMRTLQSGALSVGDPAAAPVSLPGGGVGLRLGESQMVYSVARIGPDGKLVTSCVTGKQTAEAVLKAPAKEKLDVK